MARAGTEVDLPSTGIVESTRYRYFMMFLK